MLYRPHATKTPTCISDGTASLSEVVSLISGLAESPAPFTLRAVATLMVLRQVLSEFVSSHLNDL